MSKQLHNFVCPKKKYPTDYNEITKEAIKTITISKYDFLLFGSAVFKSLIYAGDVDIRQSVPIEKISIYMKQIIKKIIKKGYIIGDIKAGIKPQLIGLLKNLGIIKNGVIVGYCPELIKEIAEKNNIVLKIPYPYGLKLNDWLNLYDQIHEIITIRWSPSEILKGYKIEDNIKYVLKDIVKSCYNVSLNKIDMYFMLDDRIIEITNVLEPEQKTFNIHVALYGIKLNMLKYLNAKTLNYPKALKRAYTIARITDNAVMLNRIVPYLTSPINYIASLLTDINVIVDILESNTKLSTIESKVLAHLNNLIERFNLVYNLIDAPYFIDSIKFIMSYSNEQDYFLEKLNIIKKELKNIVNEMTLEYIRKYQINLNMFVP